MRPRVGQLGQMSPGSSPPLEALMETILALLVLLALSLLCTLPSQSLHFGNVKTFNEKN